MKILILSQHFYPENFRFNDLALGLKEKNHDVTVLCGVPNYPKGDFFEGYKFFNKVEYWNGIKIIRSPLIPRKQSKIFLALNYVSFPFFSTIIALGLREKFDSVIVCQSSPIFMAFAATVRRFFRKEPTFLWITDLWPESLRATNTIHNPTILGLVELVVKFIYRHVDHILISCKGFEKSIRDKNRSTPVSYFPYWAEDFYKPLPRSKGLTDPSKLAITFAGNIGAAQGLHVLVDAASKLHDKSKISFIIIGEGRGMADFKDKIQRSGLEDIFIFLGAFPAIEMPQFFAGSDVLFLSLRKDPIFEITVPSKIQSYMACGKPILASIDGEAADLIQESGAGLVVPAENSERLAQALNELSSLKREELTELGSKSYDYYKANFQRSRLLDFIDNLISQK